jgi:C4-dicarboxylate-specific signal transduction histidine kinase
MSHNPTDFFTPTSLELALDQNEAIQETVEQSAAELCVINAVLQQEVPDHVKTGDVAQALLKTDELESRIQSSAESLDQVNQALKEEILVRADLERQLASAQAELEQAQGSPYFSPDGQSASC